MPCHCSRRRWNSLWHWQEWTFRCAALSPWGRRICWLVTWRRHTPSLSVRWYIPVPTKNAANEAYAMRLLGEIAAHRDSPDATQAAAYYQQALTLANELGMRPLQAHCHRGLGTLYAMTGQRDQAR